MPATQEEYVEKFGTRCPHCNAMAVEERELKNPNIDYDDEGIVPMKCRNCGSEWLDVLETKVVEYRNLVTQDDMLDKEA